MDEEIRSLLTELAITKNQILEVLKGLGDDAANWQPLPKNTNSMYSMVSHVIGAQNGWVRKIIDGQQIQRDREAELRASGPVAELIERFQKESEGVEAILGNLTLSQLSESRSTPFQPGTVSVRWCILHVLSHNATHLGHLQLTRQLWEQRAG
jgi:uncharacterized damage-inducible protein DinB